MRGASFHICIWAVYVLSCLVAAKTSWSFEDGSVSITGKSAGSNAVNEKLSPSLPLAKPLVLGAFDTLKVTLKATEGKKGKRPHQAFLTLKESRTGLEESFPLNVKESGKGKLELAQRDLPQQFLTSEQPLQASFVLASFGGSEPLDTPVFSVSTIHAASPQLAAVEGPLRYGKLKEIHHVFRDDPRSPPVLVTLVFTAAAVATLPALIVAWLALGANANHIAAALSAAPVSHGLFVGSIFALEGIFLLYYYSWNLFQMLPAVAAVGCVTYLSGSRALSEVQQRRFVGKR